MKRRTLLLATVALFSLLMAGCAGRSASTSTSKADRAQAVVDSATDTLRTYLEGPDKERLDSLIARAKGAMIIPRMGSISLIFSVGGGETVLMAKTPKGWSGPAFMSKGTAGFGLQIGVTEVSGIILYMNESDVRYVIDTGALFQGQARVTFLTKDYEGRSTPEFAGTGDVIFVGNTEGLYAGVGLSGGALSSKDDLNAAYHGVRDGGAENVLYIQTDVPEGAQTLRDLLVQAGREGKMAAETAKEKDGTEVPSE